MGSISNLFWVASCYFSETASTQVKAERSVLTIAGVAVESKALCQADLSVVPALPVVTCGTWGSD